MEEGSDPFTPLGLSGIILAIGKDTIQRRLILDIFDVKYQALIDGGERWRRIRRGCSRR